MSERAGRIEIPTQERHRVPLRLPKNSADSSTFKVINNGDELNKVSSDEAHYPDGHTPKLVRLTERAREAEVAEILGRYTSVVPIGAQSSLTGGATPKGEVVLDMSGRNKILERGKDENDGSDWIRVQSGISIYSLQEELAKHNLYYPPEPTFDGATVGGVISTNAAGAATFKYGQTRPWVKELTVVLATGEVMDIKRGQYTAHPGGYFELVGVDGEVRRVPVPKYKMPNVPKSSAGYYAEPDMDFIDLIIGSEGTLGVITEATLRVIPKPLISWGLVACKDEEQALALTKLLREDSINTRQESNPAGIDACAIEYIDQPSLQIVREDSKLRTDIELPKITKDATTLLLMQLEINPNKEIQKAQLEHLFEELDTLGLAESTQLALPNALREIERLKKIREAVPIGVNGRIKLIKDIDPRISKVAADMIVPFDQMEDMIKLFQQKFTEAGIEFAIWGHASDGNLHPNAIPKTFEEYEKAKQIIMECGQAVIKMGGSPLAEHGVGRNPIKQALLKDLYGEQGIDEMRAVKEAFDPEGKLAPGNLFPKNKEGNGDET